ncbi:hypothetical protein B0H17DRAFT_1221638 [Mycena rosella]|uniref:Uncharacterized protein n=1 Tax=Mycena rosella TaxID=1033263 RepID=A0AAD7B182_MYCRO|nr:hypothetical protein B0H17DRAFT_1221638 [Mycena rosella]
MEQMKIRNGYEDKTRRRTHGRWIRHYRISCALRAFSALATFQAPEALALPPELLMLIALYFATAPPNLAPPAAFLPLHARLGDAVHRNGGNPLFDSTHALRAHCVALQTLRAEDPHAPGARSALFAAYTLLVPDSWAPAPLAALQEGLGALPEALRPLHTTTTTSGMEGAKGMGGKNRKQLAWAGAREFAMRFMRERFSEGRYEEDEEAEEDDPVWCVGWPRDTATPWVLWFFKRWDTLRAEPELARRTLMALLLSFVVAPFQLRTVCTHTTSVRRATVYASRPPTRLDALRGSACACACACACAFASCRTRLVHAAPLGARVPHALALVVRVPTPLLGRVISCISVSTGAPVCLFHSLPPPALTPPPSAPRTTTPCRSSRGRVRCVWGGEGGDHGAHAARRVSALSAEAGAIRRRCFKYNYERGYVVVLLGRWWLWISTLAPTTLATTPRLRLAPRVRLGLRAPPCIPTRRLQRRLCFATTMILLSALPTPTFRLPVCTTMMLYLPASTTRLSCKSSTPAFQNTRYRTRAHPPHRTPRTPAVLRGHAGPRAHGRPVAPGAGPRGGGGRWAASSGTSPQPIGPTQEDIPEKNARPSVRFERQLPGVSLPPGVAAVGVGGADEEEEDADPYAPAASTSAGATASPAASTPIGPAVIAAYAAAWADVEAERAVPFDEVDEDAGPGLDGDGDGDGDSGNERWAENLEEDRILEQEDKRVGRGGAAPGRIGRMYQLGSFAGL